MNIDYIVKQSQFDYSKDLPREQDIKTAEECLDLKFENQLKNYLLNYGYLGYESIELYGLNSKQGLNSDLFKQTKYLNEYFDITKGYIAIDKIDDDTYVLIDSNDKAYRFNITESNMNKMNIKLNDYILKNF